MAEFQNEEQKDAYAAALKHERAGYERRLELAKDDGDEIAAAKLEKRIAQVDAESERARKSKPAKARAAAEA